MGVGKSRPRQSKSLKISLIPVMDECEFDTLFTRNVPHVLEKIFFSLDYASFKNCLEVGKPWRDLLTSESFLRNGKSVFCEDIQGELRLGASSGNVDTIRRVLSSFMVDMNFMTETNPNPLMLAAGNGDRNVVQLLLDRGAEPNMASQNGITPLHWATSWAGFWPWDGFKDVVHILLENGANPNMATTDGTTPLHYAVDYYGHKDLVQLLLDRGAEPNMADQGGNTPLHVAASEGYKDVVRLLLGRGAEPNMLGHNMTPLSQALQKGHAEVANILRENGGTV